LASAQQFRGTVEMDDCGEYNYHRMVIAGVLAATNTIDVSPLSRAVFLLAYLL